MQGTYSSTYTCKYAIAAADVKLNYIIGEE